MRSRPCSVGADIGAMPSASTNATSPRAKQRRAASSGPSAIGWKNYAVAVATAESLRQVVGGHQPRVKPALEQAGAKYLARGGDHKVYEGDWEPRRIVLLEFPSVDAWESFYNGSTYQRLKAIRDECSSARLVSVVGLS